MKVKKDFVGAMIGTTFVKNEFAVAKSVAASSEEEGTIVPIRSQAEKKSRHSFPSNSNSRYTYFDGISSS